MTFDAAFQVEQVGIVARGLGDLRRDEGVGLGQVVAERELASVPGRGCRHDMTNVSTSPALAGELMFLDPPLSID